MITRAWGVGTLASCASLAAVLAAAGSAAAQQANGQQIYMANCAGCHQQNGAGVPGTFPPLAHSTIVTGNAKTVLGIVDNGKTGPLKVDGKTYNGQMPAWKGKLSTDQIAAVVTYIRTSWGNHASKVSTSDVKKAGG